MLRQDLARSGKPAEATDSRRSLSARLERWAPWIFPAPAVIALALLIVFPIVYTIYMSLHDWQLSSAAGPAWYGLKNYTDLLLRKPLFWVALWRTLEFTVMALVLETVIGVSLALLFNKDFWGRGLFRSLMILPMVATPVAIALIFVMIYHPSLGVANYLLSLMHVPNQEWIYNAKTALFSLVLVDVWEWTPLIMLITMAGLAALPTDPYEAARIDGASAFQTFRYVTMPLVQPAVTVAVLFRLIDALKTFDIIFVMTQGGPADASTTLNVLLFNNAFSYFQMGYASALVVLFFAIIVGLSGLLLYYRRRGASL